MKLRTKRTNGNTEGKVQRISVSLTESVFRQLDQLVAERGWESRSKAISVMVTQSVLEHREEKGDMLMAGTITIVYDESQGNLLQQLAELERRFLDEVISSLHVQLENDHRIEVLLVQGPARTLQNIADQLLARRENREAYSHHYADATPSPTAPSRLRLKSILNRPGSLKIMTATPTVPVIDVLFEEDLPGGAMWSYALKRHHTLRLTATESGANVGVMLYNLNRPLDRLNLPDTLKAQHTAKLTAGHVLLSDMGHVLCSISADSCGWHDPLAGHSNAALVLAKYGPSTYQNERNNFHRNAHDQFLIELSKWGLGKTDLVANINFFSRVTVDADGQMRFAAESCQAGSYVDLRAEMDALLVLNTCQHPMDPDPHYHPKPVHIAVRKSDPPADDDLCRTARPENSRGFTLTEALYLA